MTETKKPNETRSMDMDNTKKNIVKKTPRFEGRSEDLKQAVFDVVDSKQKQAESYAKALREIAIFVGKEYKHGNDIANVVESLKIPDIDVDKPETPSVPIGSTKLDPTDEAIWKEEVKLFVQRKSSLSMNLKKLYALIWGQCSDGMRAEIEANHAYEEMKNKLDTIGLLKAIRGVTHSFKAQVNALQSLHIAKRTFYHLHQGNDSVPMYYEKFKTAVEVVKEMNGSLGRDMGMTLYHLQKNNLTWEGATMKEKELASDQGHEGYMATAFILGSDRRRYGRYIEDLQNDFLQGQDNYPASLVSAYNILLGWKCDPRNMIQVTRGYANDGLSFANIAGKDPLIGKDGKPMTFHEGITCYRCGRSGHYSNECPFGDDDDGVKKNNKKGEKASMMLMNAFNTGEFHQSANSAFTFCNSTETKQSKDCTLTPHTDTDSGHMTQLTTLSDVGNNTTDDKTAFLFCIKTVPGNTRTQSTTLSTLTHVNSRWILLDNQSTADIFSNPDLLIGIHKTSHTLTIHSNSGTNKTNMRGILPGYGEVWHDPNGIANILSLAHVKAKYHVTYDSGKGNHFCVTKPDGTTRYFKESSTGLFYLDIDNPDINIDNSPNSALAFLNTVSSRQQHYTPREYQRAIAARRLQHTLAGADSNHLINLLNKKLIKNCDLNSDDVRAANDIFGKDIMSLKGKTTHSKSKHVPNNKVIIPPSILDRHQNVTICIDIMKVNRIPFFISIARNIQFISAEFIANMKDTTLITSIR